MTQNFFGEEVAARYDEETAGFEPEVLDPTLDFLEELAGDGAALELGVGTGRVAVPLSQRGVRVHGIDLSEEMVARLREKTDDVAVTIGDFATTKVDESFTLVYLVCNTIMNLTTQEAQVACFQNVSDQLEPGGCFVIEVVLPDLQRLPFGEKFRLFDVSEAHIGIDEYDVVTQGLISHHYTRRRGAFEYSWGPFRYVWPSELDLMARLAGMRLRKRWSGWKREPFTATSEKLVGVWEKAA